MSIGSGLAIYFLIWWVMLFTMLPLKIRSQYDAGSVVPGSEGAAPVLPRMKLKLILTTLISLVIFAAVFMIMKYKPIPLSSIPFVGKI